MDIFKITKSKTREKILQLFFSDTGKKYYIRQLERLLDLPAGNIRRELLNLEEIGLFQKENMGNQVHYFLNKNFSLFEDFKNIVFRTIGAEGKLKEIFSGVSGVKVAFIFGSYAKKEEDALSDIDLMIIGNPNEDDFFDKISVLEKELRREINYHIFSESDWAKNIKEKNSFIINISKGHKIFIIGNENELRRIN